MDVNEKCFISILSDYVNKRKTDQLNGIDWITILNLAQIHQTEGIVYYQCKEQLPDDINKTFEKCFMEDLYDYANRTTIMGRITNTLKEKGISFFTVKGLNISKYYPFPALRTMSDCDIVVKRKDFPVVVDVFRRMGFHGKEIISSEQWGCIYNKIYVEIHDRLVQEGEYATNLQASFFNNYDSYLDKGEIDSSFHFLFLLMHLRKHFLNHGVGIRQFMDLALMSMNDNSLKWQWIEETLIKLNLHKYAHVCYSLIENWFGVVIPVQYVSLPNEDVELLTLKILKNGVFGFDDTANKNANAHTALLKAKGPMLIRRLSTLMQNVFLSYEIMRGYSDCKFIDGKQWLLPVAWGKRLVIILCRDDKTNTINVINNSFIQQSELAERRELLEKMGLL